MIQSQVSPPVTAIRTKTLPDFSVSRLHSLDALRGFDMFWIIGGEGIFHGMAEATDSVVWDQLSNQFTHPPWNGFHLYDLIFPLFIFIAGVSTPFSMERKLEQGISRHDLLLSIIKRGLILVVLGLIYNNGLEIKPIAEIRFSSVLGRIGISYIFANAIYLYFNEYLQLAWFAFLLILYWMLLKLNAAPGFEAGDLSIEGNFASYVDRSILPGKLSLKIHDTVGFFNNIPAVSSALGGIITGNFLKKSPIAPHSKAMWMSFAGLMFVCVAGIWHLDFPVNKNLWSSSFVVLTVGLSLILLSLFYFIIDVKGYKKWAFFFKVIGMNSILIYMSDRFIAWNYTNTGLFGWIYQLIGDPLQIVFLAVGLIMIKWTCLYFLYRMKIFLRV
jgi:predicted acyltransferase